jgi:anti-sigma-K factor RskA
MSDPRWEEEAALQAVGMLDEPARRGFDRAVRQDPEVAQMARDFSAIAALLAYDAPQVEPPPQLKGEIRARLDERRPAAGVISFPYQMMPYAIAACLMGLVIFQAGLIGSLKTRLRADRVAMVALQQNDSMLELRLADMKAMNNGYINSKVMVAWDPRLHRGMISMHNLPAPPPGHDYQLWVLDPSARQPVSAGLLTMGSHSQDFAARPVGMKEPGFAISLEPSGGRSLPTPGEILFAVAPGP